MCNGTDDSFRQEKWRQDQTKRSDQCSTECETFLCKSPWRRGPCMYGWKMSHGNIWEGHASKRIFENSIWRKPTRTYFSRSAFSLKTSCAFRNMRISLVLVSPGRKSKSSAGPTLHLTTPAAIGVTWRGGGQGGKFPPSQYFFNLRIIFVVAELNNGK
jgi:hypothetical protein